MTHARVATKRPRAPTATSTRSAHRVEGARAAPGRARVAMPQAKARVSQPGDPMEREANAVAARVTAGAAAQPVTADEQVQRVADEDVQRAADDEDVQRATESEDVQRTIESEQVQRATESEQVQRAIADEPVQRRERPGGGSAPGITPRTARTIANPGAGAPLSRSVRGSIEPHLGADLGGVRVHTGPPAVHAATSLRARAFTVGHDVFLNRGESPRDVGLMAHEATHVVQQAAAPGREAARSTDEVQLLPDFITDELADYARHVPGYSLLTYIIEYDPLRGERVEPTAMALVEGLMGLVPFGTFVFDQLRELGVLERAFEFIQTQLATFDLSLERLERTITEAWDDMDFVRTDPFDYNLGVLTRHFGQLVDDVTGFASSVLSAVMDLIKEALIGVAEKLLAENKAWDLIKKILHYDPLRGVEVDVATVEILEDFLLLIGREQELEQMRARGTLQKTADWLDTQVATFSGLLTELSSLFSAAWEAIQPANLPELPTTLPALALQAGAFLQRVWDFATTVATQVIALIKDALLGQLASFVDQVPGFHLVTVILGRNPFTGEKVPRTAVNLIRGFITLILGGDAIYERLAETGVIAEAGARIEGAIADLGISWEFVVGLFTGIWDTVVSIDTLIDPIGVFTRIRDQFGEPISRLFAFIRVVLRTMFELLLALMQFPTDLIGRIIDNAMLAYEQIKRDPIGFLINMLAAVKLGFSNFFTNILTHLTGGLVDWLFRGLRAAGIEPPEDLSPGAILDTVLQVLGISVERIWEKLAQRFGQETIDKIRAGIGKVEGIWQVVQDISERGIGALWEYVESQLSNLWNTVLQAATDWIMEQIIGRVVAKLLSLLDPTGIMAVINGFIAFFNAIQSAIEYLREILEIIDSYVATIAAVASGDIEPGAARLEAGFASTITVAIGFLAGQVGLGNIGQKIAEIVGRVREVVDKALDWLLAKLEAVVNRVLSMLGVGKPVAGKEPAADVDPTDHVAFADHAAKRLQTAASERGDLAEVTALAHELEPTLSAQLQPGIGLHFQFTGGADDAADNRVHVKVVIAPNNTELETDVTIGNSNCVHPGHSAAGVGESQPHAAKPTSNRSGPPVLHTESEHIIPYAIGDALLEVIGVTQGSRSASRKFDGALTTIMIYKGAANEKTRGDPTADIPQIKRFKPQMRAAAVPARVERGEHFAQAGGGRTDDAVDAFAQIIAAIEGFRADAVTRTKAAVANEWKAYTDGCEATNGQRRAEKEAIPSDSKIEEAGKEEHAQIYTFAHYLFEARGDRPITRPETVPAAIETLTIMQLNGMTQRGEFMLIRGVGPTLAARLAEAREKQPWQSKADLAKVVGIGPAFLARIT